MFQKKEGVLGEFTPPCLSGAQMLHLRHITKTYPGVVALRDVSLSVATGEVLGLVGENGAGKSTLMKVLGGIVPPSSGEIVIDGTSHDRLTVERSMASGIAFVHQELNLFENLDVAANVFIGREPRHFGPLRLIDTKRLHAQVEPFLARLGADFGPTDSVADLSIAQRQLVEIAKALSLDARILILDEPTSSLTLTETDRLLRVIADLKAHGVSVIYISHRLSEVEECADRVVCLRDGRVAGELARDEISHAAMIRLMIGRDLKSLYLPPANPSERPFAEIEGMATSAFPDARIDLVLRQGEILGLAGLVGSGRTTLAQTLFGIETARAGTLRIDGTPVRPTSPAEAIHHGIYLVPEDRKRCGLVLDMSITENVTLPNLGSYAGLVSVDRRAEAVTAEAQRRSLSIRTASVETPATSLSGGNQQKVVLAKWLAMAPRLMILDEPTRGIDVGSKAEIYALMRALADRGVAILMISSDMEEVIGVSDRIAVMHEGRISGILGRDQATEHAILSLAIGHAHEVA